MKTWIVGACIAALAASLTFVPSDADAKKRFGGGNSSGMQRDMPTRNAPDAPPAKPATPAQGATPAAAPAAAAGATAAAAATRKSSWLGPIAGIAAAVGLVALMSSLGLGEEFANFLMLALLGVATIALVLWAMRRFGNKNAAMKTPAMAGASAGSAGSNTNPFSTAQPSAEPAMARSSLSPQPTSAPTATGSAGAPFVPAWPTPGTEAQATAEDGSTAGSTTGKAIAFERGHIPADFDTAGFERVASMIFIRMQAAHDAADLNDLRTFTTPEMFAAVKMDLQDRQGASQHTEVETVNAEVLDVATDDSRQIVSVRFHGRIREEGEAAPEAFDEVWHLVKPLDNSRNWAIAGIQQQPMAV
jgi:predicted lipid-binding transport protein (Tim44 family)